MSKALSHPHDRVVPLSQRDLSVLDGVDKIIEEAVSKRDPFVALEYGASMRRAGHTIGIGLAKLVYELRIRWEVSEEDGGFSRSLDTFVDDASAILNVSTQTVAKYGDVWQYVLLSHPELISKPMEALLLLSAAAKEGQLTNGDWKKIEKAPDKQTIRDIVRDRRGSRTSSESVLVILVDRDGTLKARKGAGSYIPIGMLNTDSTEPVVIAAITRIINAAGILEQ